MKFQDLKSKLKNFLIFPTSEIFKIDPDFHRARLVEWQKKNYIKKVINNYYVFSDQEFNTELLFLIANKIYEPSYISLDSALSFYNLIPETVYGVSSLNTKNTYSFDTDLATFIYRKIKPDLFFGYKFANYRNQKFKIAEVEKLILDSLYFNPELSSHEAFVEWRLDLEELKNIFDVDRFNKYLEKFKSKALKKRAEEFLRFINND